MIKIEVNITIETEDELIDAEARAWFDSSPEEGLEWEREIPLKRRAGLGFRGHCVLGSDASVFMYRVAMVAQAGAYWTIEIHELGRGRRLVLDSDVFSTRKCQLVGSCGLKRDRTPATFDQPPRLSPLRFFDALGPRPGT